MQDGQSLTSERLLQDTEEAFRVSGDALVNFVDVTLDGE